ncbi:MAG: flagellin FliC [Deltaproteobacteria bacterium]|nr:flagellin FliC [Deltaproteobacteria bacterium]
MGLRVRTNVDSLVAQRRLSEQRGSLSQSLERLSSGLRINKSADDAAGLAVSERLRGTMSSLGVAKRNASDGISYIEVAEGGLNEVSNILIRMRELATQAASDTLGPRERSFLDKEFTQLRDEVGRIIDSTEFNGTKVLTPGEGDKPIQIFVGASNRGRDAAGDLPDIDKDSDPDVLTIKLDELGSLKDAIDQVRDKAMSIMPDPTAVIGAQDLGPDGDTATLFSRLDTAQNSIASYRATLGSVQSRLNSTINNIDIASENMAAAQSRIRDVDYASETAKLTQGRILSTAALSVMTQANASPEAVLQLLRG